MLEKLAHALDDNPALARRNRFARLTIAVRAGERSWTVRLGGEPIAVADGQTAAPDISLEGSPQAWAEFARPVPAPGYQSLNAMMRLGHLKVSGNMLEFGRHLMLIEEVFARMRDTDSKPVAPAPVGTPWIEAVTGRYLHLDLDGRSHRIYFEEAGPPDGIPLLCLH